MHNRFVDPGTYRLTPAVACPAFFGKCEIFLASRQQQGGLARPESMLLSIDTDDRIAFKNIDNLKVLLNAWSKTSMRFIDKITDIKPRVNTTKIHCRYVYVSGGHCQSVRGNLSCLTQLKLKKGIPIKS